MPLSPLMYSTYTGTVAGGPFLPDMSHKLATGLEARYIVVAEVAGQHLGDLRRYLKYENIDLFPKGPYPVSTTGQVYDQSITCWPLPRVEINANPNTSG
ncbi:MAG: hypothetical protein ACR2GK_10030 [Gemmatimonadaceae bacterium]